MANVLIIDDDQDVTHLLKSHLSDEGHHVTTAHHGEEGLAFALKTPPDLILLDVFLPDATGYQICGQLRKSEATRMVPVIMMTGAARFPNQQMFGRERGANEYVFKPFDMDQMSSMIHKYITPCSKNPAAATQQPMSVVKSNRLSEREPDARNGNAKPMVPSGPKPIEVPSDLQALSSFLEQSMSKNPPAEPPPPSKPAAQPAASAASASDRGEFFAPGVLSSKDRFIEFGMEIFALATRLSSSHVEKFLAEELLRCGLAVGAQLTASRSAGSRGEFMGLLNGALQDLRQTSYWLMIANKAGLLATAGKPDLEKTALALVTLLTDFVNNEKKRIHVT